MALEDRHLDVLQNIEFAIVSVYREQPNLRDWDVMRGLDALIDVYRAEVRGHTPKEVDLPEPELTVFERTKTICEVRLGRQAFEIASETPAPPIAAQTGLGRVFRSVAEKLGRSKAPPQDDEDDMTGDIEDEVTAEVIVACLRKIRRSVERWNKRGGTQGYLQFVQEHV